ncbi:MAG: ribonuclease P protein component [Chloroflexota bacterium]|nr:ribonuclease P protein component [Chloroflexota bacterium]NCA15235.1 ribonuclease P protein component [Pseudomonadota bacterium]
MLSRAQRITTAAGFGAVRRSGTSAGSALVTVGAVLREGTMHGPARFGFVVSRRVGKAHVRNLVKRRLRAAARSVSDNLTGWDIVVSAKPPAASAHYAELSAAMSAGIRRATRTSSAVAPLSRP